MAYWWVSQNKTFTEESEGGFLWAPKFNKAGRTLHHWETMLDVREGDVVLSYVGQHIVAVAVAQGNAFDAERPFHSGEGTVWEKDGRMVKAVYQVLDEPISISPMRKELVSLLPTDNSPLTREGSGIQGYLFHLPAAAAELMLGDERSHFPSSTAALLQAIERSPLDQTTKTALVESRIGQARFRRDLVAMWGGRCAVTNLAVTSLLRASHSKPWRASNNLERLDPFNGLLLAPSFDAALDAGLISFGDDGALLLSSGVPSDAVTALGINVNASLRSVHVAHRPFLAYHRQHVFTP